MVENNQILYLSFNYNNKYFTVGTETGFKVFLTENLTLKFDRNLGGGISIIQMLNESNIFCLVGGGKSPKYAPNKLYIWDDIQGKEVLEYRFNSFVKNCKIKKEKLFIICNEEIIIIDLIDSMDIIETIKTCDNIYNACSISNEPEKYIFAWPDINIGYIEIKNFKNDDDFLINENKQYHIKAHQNLVEIIEINFKGTKFASASNKGNLIKVFSIFDGNLIHEFRRGTEQAIIYNISFDLNDTLLVVSSNRPTVHLFALIDKNNPNKGNKDIQNSKSMFNGISKILGVGKILQSEWSFAQIKVPSDYKSIVSIFGKDNKIVFVNYQGKYISAVYSINSDSSVECKITKNVSIFKVS